MILVSEREKAAVQERCPKTIFRRTCKTKTRRHRYYMEETDGAMAMLRRLRGAKIKK